MTNEKFADILQAGEHRNSLGRAQEVIETVLANPSRLDELVDCIYDADAWVRMRAIDSFEKIIRQHRDWVRPYVPRIFSELTQSSQASVQWHLAQLFVYITLTHKQQIQAMNWLKARLATTDVDWIVAVNTMKTLVVFHQKGLVKTSELQRLLETQHPHASKTVRKKAGEFFAQITSMK